MKNSTFKLNMVLMVVCTIFSMNPVSAQEKTTFEMLQDKVWVMQFPNPNDIGYFEVKYTASEQVDVVLHENTPQYEKKYPYYLSSIRTNVFDTQKVRRVLKGKYIVVNSEARNPQTDSTYYNVIVYEIIELTATDLKIKKLSDNVVLSFKSK